MTDALNNTPGSDVVETNEVEQLEFRLRSQLNGLIRGFRLVLDSGFGVVLYGQAQTYYAKQIAQHAVMRETDISIFKNAIEVCKPTVFDCV